MAEEASRDPTKKFSSIEYQKNRKMIVRYFQLERKIEEMDRALEDLKEEKKSLGRLPWLGNIVGTVRKASKAVEEPIEDLQKEASPPSSHESLEQRSFRAVEGSFRLPKTRPKKRSIEKILSSQEEASRSERLKYSKASSPALRK